MMQQWASIYWQLQIWGVLETWSLEHILNEKAKFIHCYAHRSLFGRCHEIHYDRSSTAYLPITFSNNTLWVIFKYFCLIMRQGLLICSKVGGFACLSSKFRWSGTSTIGQPMLRHSYTILLRLPLYQIGIQTMQWSIGHDDMCPGLSGATENPWHLFIHD